MNRREALCLVGVGIPLLMVSTGFPGPTPSQEATVTLSVSGMT